VWLNATRDSLLRAVNVAQISKRIKIQLMKKILSVLFCAVAFVAAQAQVNNFEITLKQAKENNKLVLLNFSGSDWCIPCIKMHKEIFENTGFKNATDSLVIFVNADFPRMKFQE
jgi:thioredoxin-related protein